MTIKEIKLYLLNKKGYLTPNGNLKKSYSWLANKTNSTVDDVREAVNQIRNKSFAFTTDITPSKSRKFNSVSDTIDTTLTTPGTYWITGCAHAPWHNKKMYEATFNYLANEVNLSGIILAGDIIDANSLSTHDRGNIALPGVTLDWEYKQSNKFLDQIDEIYEWCKVNKTINNKFYLYGNHEDRYLRLIRGVDAAKYGNALRSPEDGLNLIKRGYTVLSDWKNDSVRIGKHLDINHGEFCNVHTAKKTIDTYRKSTLYFHTHRFQIFMEGQVAGFNMGAGADFSAPIFGYATRAMKNSWTNASALVTLDNEGFYHVQPLLFINNKLIVNGKQY